MNTVKIVAIILLVVGGLSLAYGGFSYTKQTDKVNLGPLHLSVDEKQQVNVPVWAGFGVMLMGVVLLVLPRKS